MPGSSHQAPSRQRRANWVGLRTLRQLPTAVGETAAGEPIYDVRSVRLLLDGAAPNFVRLAECSRCGRELAGVPVLTAADLERPLRPMICDDCIGGAGVSTVGESTVGESGGGEPAGERPTPLAPAVSSEPAPAPAEVNPERLGVMEGHLRAVIDRVNELGRVARAHQADIKEQARRQDATAAALRGDLAALRAASDDTRAELQGLARVQAELQGLARVQAELQGLAERQAGDGASAGQLREEVAQLARLVEAQRHEVVEFVAAVGETKATTGKLAVAHEELAGAIARFDPSTSEDLIATRLAEAEGRLAEAVARPAPEVDLSTVEELIATRLSEAEARLMRRIAGQRGDLDAAIDGLAGQVAQAFRRMEILLDRLDILEAAALQPPSRAPSDPAPAPEAAAAGNFLDGLERQLEAAARQLAARSRASAGGVEP